MLDALPGINAAFNSASFLCLLLGFVAIKRKARDWHMRFMLMAVGCSVLFLVGYLTRTALSGTHRFPEAGGIKVFYLVLLFSHMILAAIMVPMILRLLFLAWKKRFANHRALARWTWPIWVYVSLTGIVVYVMLYHVAPGLTG